MVRQGSTVQLNERAQDVLKTLIREFVEDGKPVGSRRLAKNNRERLSSATLRNVMADLEKVGFLTQPHTSAGRVPTAKGYRFYVDSLSDTRPLTAREVARIKQSLEQETDPGELMSKTSQVLSTLSNNVGFVLAPPISRAAMKHIKFVRIAQKRILVILVTGSGLVQHRLIQTDQDFSQREIGGANTNPTLFDKVERTWEVLLINSPGSVSCSKLCLMRPTSRAVNCRVSEREST